MDTIAVFLLEEDEVEQSPSVQRKHLRDKSNPLDIPEREYDNRLLQLIYYFNKFSRIDLYVCSG